MSIVALVIAPGIALQDSNKKAENTDKDQKEIIIEKEQSSSDKFSSNKIHIEDCIDKEPNESQTGNMAAFRLNNKLISTLSADATNDILEERYRIFLLQQKANFQ
jgi:hypothetical protein